jgi:hypothetical protein
MSCKRRRLVGLRREKGKRRTNLSGSIDLTLPGVLTLTEHGSSADLGAVLASNEVGSL